MLKCSIFLPFSLEIKTESNTPESTISGLGRADKEQARPLFIGILANQFEVSFHQNKNVTNRKKIFRKHGRCLPNISNFALNYWLYGVFRIRVWRMEIHVQQCAISFGGPLLTSHIP